MARGSYTTTTKRTRKGMTTKVKVGSSITKRDHQEAKSKRKHELEMAKIANEGYQKEVTKRANAVLASAAVATPTTTALANTNAFASGGFEVNSNDDEEADNSSGNRPTKPGVWGG